MGSKFFKFSTSKNIFPVWRKDWRKKISIFNSHYKDRFYDKNPPPNTSTQTHVLKQLSNGFTKSTAVNSFGGCAGKFGGQGVGQLNPYVKKSIDARFPYTDHDTKYIRT